MQSIGSFFDKFKNVVEKEITLRQSVIDAVKKNIANDDNSSILDGLNQKDIDIRNKIVRIHANPALKNQIFIKKESILKSIREANPQAIITDLQ
jgi:hypothetical protein